MKKQIPNGCFITLEGQECAGKSTQLSLLSQWLVDSGYEVRCTREPGGTLLAEKIRTLLLDQKSTGNEPITPEAELLLFSASRAQHMKQVIQPVLDRGGIVICDRFYDSTTAYQGYARGLNLQVLHRLHQFCTGGRQPDRTFILDLTVAESRRRLALRSPGAADRMESEADSFFEKVRQGFLAIAREEPMRVKVIDASQSIDEIQSQLRQEVLCALSRN